MPYRLPTVARNNGSVVYTQYSAPRLLLCKASKVGDGRSGTTSSALRSAAAMRSSSSRYWSAFFRGSTASKALACILNTESGTVQASSGNSGREAVSGTSTLLEAYIPQATVKLQKQRLRNPDDAVRHPVASEANFRNVVLKRAPAHIIALRIAALTSVLTLCGAFWLYAGSMIAGAV